jgi:putative oxidoreductase
MKALCKWAQQYGPLVGRLLLANLFIVSGFKKITGFAASAGYMAAKMPALDPNLINIMLALTIVIELGGA